MRIILAIGMWLLWCGTSQAATLTLTLPDETAPRIIAECAQRLGYQFGMIQTPKAYCEDRLSAWIAAHVWDDPAKSILRQLLSR